MKLHQTVRFTKSVIRRFSTSKPTHLPRFHRGIAWEAEVVNKGNAAPASFYSVEKCLTLSSDLDIPRMPETEIPANATLVARLSLEGFTEDHIDFFSYFAKHSAAALKLPTSAVAKPQPDIKRIRVNKSPFVHGKSREVYEVKTYRHSIDVYNSDGEVVDRWVYYLKQHAPPGIRIIVEKWHTREIGFGKEMLEKAQAVLKERDARRGIPN